MKKLFYPSSIAVFGVSEAQDNFGRNIVKNLLDFHFEGEIYPIGRKEGSVYGLDIRTSIEEVEGDVDLAVFLVPARFIPGYMEACAEKGVRRMMISSGGFSELSEDGASLEKQILDIAQKYGIRFLGPNCIAAINQDIGMCLPFVRMHRFIDGPVSCLTQSGGVGLSLINQLTGQNVGINKYISLGNKLNVGEEDMIPFLEEDENTKLILFYLEEIGRGREFMEAVRGCTKPVVVLKSNTEAETASVAQSHTAAIANDDRVVNAAFRQLGVTRPDEFEQVVPTCKAFSMPEMKGNRVAVITPTGGYAVIIADMCAKYGFELPAFPQPFIDEVSKHVKAGVIRLSNPLDLGDMFDFEMVAHTVMQAIQQDEFDAIVLSWILLRDIGVDKLNIFTYLDRMRKATPKPVILSLVGDPLDIAQIQKQTKYPIFTSPEQSIRALARLRDFHRDAIALRTQKPALKEIDGGRVRQIIDAARRDGRAELGMESLELLDACGIPAAPFALAASAGDAARKAAEIGFPVAMKIASPDILHKTEVSGVRLGVKTEAECRAAFDELTASAAEAAPGSAISGVYVQGMVSGAREMLAGINYNEAFGHVVVFGLGGTLVEALEDVSMRITPLGPMDAEKMICEIRSKKILGEFRGMAPADVEAIQDALLRLSTLVGEFPEIRELDINPLAVFPAGGGCAAVDARIVLS